MRRIIHRIISMGFGLGCDDGNLSFVWVLSLNESFRVWRYRL